MLCAAGSNVKASPPSPVPSRPQCSVNGGSHVFAPASMFHVFILPRPASNSPFILYERCARKALVRFLLHTVKALPHPIAWGLRRSFRRGFRPTGVPHRDVLLPSLTVVASLPSFCCMAWRSLGRVVGWGCSRAGPDVLSLEQALGCPPGGTEFPLHYGFLFAMHHWGEGFSGGECG